MSNIQTCLFIFLLFICPSVLILHLLRLLFRAVTHADHLRPKLSMFQFASAFSTMTLLIYIWSYVNTHSFELTQPVKMYLLFLLSGTLTMWYAFFFMSEGASIAGSVAVFVSTFVEPTAATYTVSLALLGLIGFFMVMRENNRVAAEKRTIENIMEEKRILEKVEKLKRSASFSMCSASFPRKFRNLYIAKEYTHVPLILCDTARRIAFKWPEFQSGALLSFIPDVENPKNVACTLDGKLIGTIGQQGLAEYLYDLLIQDIPFLGYLSAYDAFAETAEIKIARYEESVFQSLVDACDDPCSFRLVGNTDDTSQDELEICERGDECSFSYNSETDKYTVSHNGISIGRLPASAASIVRELEDDVVIYIAETGESSRGKITASVYIFD